MHGNMDRWCAVGLALHMKARSGTYGGDHMHVYACFGTRAAGGKHFRRLKQDGAKHCAGLVDVASVVTAAVVSSWDVGIHKNAVLICY